MWHRFFEIFTMLFVVMDPPGMVPPFLSLTQGKNQKQKRTIALRATVTSVIILVSFTLLGNFVLHWFKISEAAFYIAGGLLLFRAALNMVLVEQPGIDTTTTEENLEAAQRDDVSIFPLAIPLLAGPGAIATVILLSGKSDLPLVQQSLIIIALMVISSITYLFLRVSESISKLLGVTGTNVIGRIFGVILAAFSVQFILNGIALFLQ